jgi:DNA-binding Lrp family transcriptional regulator
VLFLSYGEGRARTKQTNEIDRSTLYQLQCDARLTATEIGDRVGVSDTTVRSRMKVLPEQRIIGSYTTLIVHERAGFQRPFQFTCTVPIIEREEVAKGALDVPGVVPSRSG